MHEMMELKEMLCDELEKITKQGKITTGILDTVDKLTHSIKSLETIIAMNEKGYSNRMPVSYAVDHDGSYGEDHSYRIRKDGGRDMRYNYSRDGYSRDLKHNLRDLMHTVDSEHDRRMIEKWMRQLDD